MTITFGRYRLRRYDSRNLVLEEYREPAPDSGARRSGDKSPKWRSCDRYFQSLGHALRYAYDRELIADDGEYDVEGAIARAEEIAERLASSVTVEGGDAE